jgi:hypothetical protein
MLTCETQSLGVHRAQRHPWVAAQVLDPLAAAVHVHDDLAVLEEVPGRVRDRLTVRSDHADGRVVRPLEELGDFAGTGGFGIPANLR